MLNIWRSIALLERWCQGIQEKRVRCSAETMTTFLDHECKLVNVEGYEDISGAWGKYVNVEGQGSYAQYLAASVPRYGRTDEADRQSYASAA